MFIYALELGNKRTNFTFLAQIEFSLKRRMSHVENRNVQYMTYQKSIENHQHMFHIGNSSKSSSF